MKPIMKRIAVLVTFVILTAFTYVLVFASPSQNPPKGPISIGAGPISQASINKTEVVINIPAKTIDVKVTIRFNQTGKYFIYAMLPYAIEDATPYGVYEHQYYPLSTYLPSHEIYHIELGNFSKNFMNTPNGSSVANATIELNPDFYFHFLEPDLRDELTIGLSVKIKDSLIAVADSLGGRETAIYTFFGDVSGMWTDTMSAYMRPNSQQTLKEQFTVYIALPPAYYFSSSQPAPIEYYVKQESRWLMFSMDFLNGQYAQTLVCSFENPACQLNRELGIFLIGVFSTLTITFVLETFKEAWSVYAQNEEPKQKDKTA